MLEEEINNMPANLEIGGLKAKTNKKQRPRSAGQQTYGYGERDREHGNLRNDQINGDFMKNFNDVVCQSMYQVIDPHAEAELPSSSQMELEDDLSNIDPNATTPPCLLNTSDPSGNVQIIPTLFSNNHQTLANGYASPSSNDNAPTSTTVDTDKPSSKLADFKVQDLKNELKKRQLPVSGTKPQLLDRLKPYEDEIIISSTTTYTLPEDSDSVDSTIDRVAHSHDINHNLTPTATANINVKPCCGNPNCTENSSVPLYIQSEIKQPTMRDVIHNYLENPQQTLNVIAQNCQREVNKPIQPQLVLKLPQNICQAQQVVQLVDTNGAVIGVATVMNPNPTQAQNPCCGCGNTGQSLADRRRVTIPNLQETRDDPMGILPGQNQNFGQNMIPSTGIPSQATFSFASLGSGGEFTLIQSGPTQISSNIAHVNENSACHGCAKSCGIGQTQIAPANISASIQPHIIMPKTNFSCHSCHINTQNHQTHKPKPIHTPRISEDCCPKRQEPTENPLTRRRSLPSLNSKPNQPEVKPNPSKNDSKPEKFAPTIKEHKEDSSDSTEPTEEIDTSVLFTAETMSLHEEILRSQHKKIEELQEELRNSQNQLREQQQMILKAKRAQMRQETEEGRIQSPTEAWLIDLDIKQLNKMHIQHFLHLRLQQQQMQGQVQEYQKLATAEQILQEELHIEQAVKDIVRLIKQDARTSLLIVQLLRRYQLERCHQIQAAQQQVQQAANSISCQQDCGSSLNCNPQTTVSVCNSTCCQPSQNMEHTQSQEDGSKDEDNDIIEIPIEEKVKSVIERVEQEIKNGVEEKNGKEEQKMQRSQKKKVVKAKTDTIKAQPFPSTKTSETLASDSTPSKEDPAKKKSTPSSNIDMEEIFKNVLEGASRVLRGEDPFDSGKPLSKKKKKSSCTNNQNPEINRPPVQAQLKPVIKKSKAKPKPMVEEEVQMSDQTMMVYSEENMEMEEGFPMEMNFGNGEDFGSQPIANYNKLPSCSQLLNPSRDHNIETTINFLPTSTHYQTNTHFATINIDCSGKIDYSAVASAASFNNPQIMGNFINEPCQATVYFNGQENIDHVDIDDLLDVLRDDQENPTRSSSQNEHTLGYTSDELVNFLSVDWNHQKSHPLSEPPYNFIQSTKSNMSAMDGFSLDSDSHQGSVATIVSSESLSDSTENDFLQQSMDQFNMPPITNQMLSLPNGNVCLQNNPMFSPMPQHNDGVENMDWWENMQNPLMITPNDAHSMQLSVNSIHETGFQPMDALV